MSNIPLPGQIYRHFKGNLYRIVTMARHSETGEELVVYQALYGEYQVYARPLSMFLERIDKEKYPEALQKMRFELQEELIGTAAKPESVLSEEADPDTSKEEKKAQQDISDTGSNTTTEELNIDPLVLEFLDAGTYEERLNILASLHHRITDDMINVMSMAVDVEIEEGDTENRFEQLRNCLLTLERYECNRLR